MNGLSRLRNPSLLKPWSSRTLFWWGHRTKEDADEEQRKMERRRLKKWSGPGKSSSLTTQSKILLQQDSSADARQLLATSQSVERLSSSAESALAEYEEHRSSYLPSRIDEEAGVLRDPAVDVPAMKRTHTQWMNKIRRPILSRYFAYEFYVEQSRKREYLSLISAQTFDEERLTALGPDLSAAWFLLSRNCKIKFKDRPEWIEFDSRGTLNVPVPNEYTKGYYIEGIEASRSLLIYEGFQNLRNLMFLRHLDISYCEMMDEWCLDRIVGEYKDSLEYLDISGCYRIDWNGIECLWKLGKLKVLVMHDLEHIDNLPLLCLLLLEVNPHLEIRGVNYMDLELLKGTESERMIQEFERDLLHLEPGERKVTI